MRDGIIYDCPHANCRTPIDTGKCSKACIERYNKEMGKKPMTNADRIRALSDEELSVFLWEFEKEEIARATEYALERRKITEWLKQPAEE